MRRKKNSQKYSKVSPSVGSEPVEEPSKWPFKSSELAFRLISLAYFLGMYASLMLLTGGSPRSTCV